MRQKIRSAALGAERVHGMAEALAGVVRTPQRVAETLERVAASSE